MNITTGKQASAAIGMAHTIAEAIRILTLEGSLGGVPNGHLWARVDGQISFENYNSILDILKRAKLIKESNNLLIWTGPKLAR